MARKPDTSAIELKSATLEAMRALLRSADTAELTAALDARLGGMPGFFSGEPVVIDCGELPAGSTPDLAALRDALGRHALTAVAVQTADEIPLLIKTCAARYAELEAAIRAQHPYQTPEIIALPVAHGLPAYLAWVAAETEADHWTLP